MDSTQYAKILFCLDPIDDEWPPFDIEGVWAVALPDGTYRVENIPFFAFGVSLGDRVAVHKDENALWSTSVVEQAGHCTVRVVMHDIGEVAGVRAALRSMGCSSELSNFPQLIAVDIPPEADVQQVLAWLRAQGRERADFFEFEEANVSW